MRPSIIYIVHNNLVRRRKIILKQHQKMHWLKYIYISRHTYTCTHTHVQNIKKDNQVWIYTVSWHMLELPCFTETRRIWHQSLDININLPGKTVLRNETQAMKTRFHGCVQNAHTCTWSKKKQTTCFGSKLYCGMTEIHIPVKMT